MHDAQTPTLIAKSCQVQVSTLQMSGIAKCNHPPCSRHNGCITECLRKTRAPSHIRLHPEMGQAVCINGGLLGYAAVAFACLAPEERVFGRYLRPEGRKVCCSLDQSKGCALDSSIMNASLLLPRQQTRSPWCYLSHAGTE